MKNASVFWDKAAQKYAKSPIADLKAYTYTLERTRSYLSPTHHILEVGCGTGSTSLLLAENVEQITASDYSKEMIEIGRQKSLNQGVSNVKFINADLFDNSLDGGPYDVVLAFNLLHLLPDTPAAIGRIHDLLKPGGLLISKTFCPEGEKGSFKFHAIKMILPLMQWVGKAPYVNFMKIAELEEFITSNNFEIIETGNYPAVPPSRYIVARKMLESAKNPQET